MSSHRRGHKLPRESQAATNKVRSSTALTALTDAPWLALGDTLLGYFRSSTDEQDRSCPQQVREVGRFWAEQGKVRDASVLTVRSGVEQGIYVDEGVSGWKTAPDHRPASAAMLAYCAAHPQPQSEPGVITVWALSRLGRFPDGPMEAFHWLYHFHRLGWRFWSLSEGDLACNDEDRLLKVLKIALHAEKDTASSEDKARGVVRGKRHLREHGLWQGSFPPFGYDRWAARVSSTKIQWIEPLPVGKRNAFADPAIHTLLRPNDDAPAVRQIYQWAAEGESGRTVSLAEICARMNGGTARPYVTRHGAPHGTGWWPSTVGRVLSNEAYLGIQLDAAGQEYPARWEALIDRATWRAVRLRLKDNATRPRAVNTAYVLTGLLTCAHCGSRLHGERLRNTAGVVLYYRTGRVPGTDKCSACTARLRADVVEPTLIAAICEFADDPAVLQAVADEQSMRSGHSTSRSARRQSLIAARDAAQAEITRLLDLAGMGGEVARQARERIAAANHDVARISEALERLAHSPSSAPTVHAWQQQARQFATLFESASMSERKMMLRCFVVRVDVDIPGESLTVHYRRLLGLSP
jgi:DNA invertase Pin-like site-specific DNA recombinase